MRNVLFGLIVVTVAALLWGSPTKALADGFKVGFVYMDEIRQKGQPYQEAFQRLQQASQQHQQEAQQRQGEIQRLQEQLQRQASLMTEQVRSQREAQIRQKVSEYEEWAGRASQDFQKQQLDAIQPIDERVIQLIKAVAERNNYDVVLDGSAIAYIKNEVQNNLTEAVIQELNQGTSASPTAGSRRSQ